jgi:hypothetical protein
MQVIGFLSALLRIHGCLNVVPTSYSVRIFDLSVTQLTGQPGGHHPEKRTLSFHALNADLSATLAAWVQVT